MSNPVENVDCFGTKEIHAGQQCDQWSNLETVPPKGSNQYIRCNYFAELLLKIVLPVHGAYSISSLFLQGYCYGRDGNPTRKSLARCLTALDNGRHSLVFPSGCASTSAVLHLLETGDHIVSCFETYGGTRTLLLNQAKAKGIEVNFVDSTDAKLVERAIKSNTKVKLLIFLLKVFQSSSILLGSYS